MATQSELNRGEALDLMWKAVNLDTARDCIWQMKTHEAALLDPEKQLRRQNFLAILERNLEEECNKAMLEAFEALKEYLGKSPAGEKAVDATTT